MLNQTVGNFVTFNVNELFQFLLQAFEDYWSLEDVSDGLKREELHKGTIRINPRNFEEAYLDNPVSSMQTYPYVEWARKLPFN